ncbi:MAG: response regulator [Leptospiraceae bacterium]|nr:response regulator [Leptospiraceae bacterium]MCP5501525.1 response regulator [Leptospiraceae bacterium]
MNKSILIVEDVDSIRVSIRDALLAENFQVFDAKDAETAIELLHRFPIHLVLSDIRMPGKSGLELIDYVKNNFPEIQYALITAYDINHYVHYAYEHKIYNIIPKYSFLDFKFISVVANKLLSGDIFGVEKYFEEKLQVVQTEQFKVPAENEVVFTSIYSDTNRVELCENIGTYMIDNGAPTVVFQILEELSSNAMIRAPRDIYGNSKYQYEFPSKDILIPLKNITLEREDAFQLGFGICDNIFIIVTRDRFGSLRKEEILKRFDRHIYTNPETGLPFGLSDSHGRGLFICREIADSIIFNIKRNVMTEVIAFLQPRTQERYHKSLSIFEINS